MERAQRMLEGTVATLEEEGDRRLEDLVMSQAELEEQQEALQRLRDELNGKTSPLQSPCCWHGCCYPHATGITPHSSPPALLPLQVQCSHVFCFCCICTCKMACEKETLHASAILRGDSRPSNFRRLALPLLPLYTKQFPEIGAAPPPTLHRNCVESYAYILQPRAHLITPWYHLPQLHTLCTQI